VSVDHSRSDLRLLDLYSQSNIFSTGYSGRGRDLSEGCKSSPRKLLPHGIRREPLRSGGCEPSFTNPSTPPDTVLLGSHVLSTDVDGEVLILPVVYKCLAGTFSPAPDREPDRGARLVAAPRRGLPAAELTLAAEEALRGLIPSESCQRVGQATLAKYRYRPELVFIEDLACFGEAGMSL
jgi:hypothetical protein